MDTMVYIVIGIVCVVVWGLIGWEVYRSPIMPDDYPNEPSQDQEYSEDNWNRGVKELGPNPNSQLDPMEEYHPDQEI